MTGEIEAAGDALTGGLVAGAVEPGFDGAYRLTRRGALLRLALLLVFASIALTLFVMLLLGLGLLG